MLAVNVTITGRYICSANIYCDNNDNNVLALQIDLPIIVTITVTTAYRYPRYFHNNC
jgi:hypothetical protein